MPALSLQEHYGQIDIYLFDQLLKGHITPGMRILDAGCGSGRNITYFLREGYQVCAADQSAEAIHEVRSFAHHVAPHLPESNFRVESVEAMSFDDASADLVICNTVLHFATDDAHFERMLLGGWRKLKPGGLYFCRLASTCGMESEFQHVEGRIYKSPDGAQRYLVDHGMLMAMTAKLGATLAEPLKTTLVHGMRAMTTWILRKNP